MHYFSSLSALPSLPPSLPSPDAVVGPVALPTKQPRGRRWKRMEATRIKEGRAGQDGQSAAGAFYDLATSDSGNKSSGDSAWRQRASDGNNIRAPAVSATEALP